MFVLQTGLLVLLLASCDRGDADDASSFDNPQEVTVIGELDWSMPDRFGVDANDDGRPDMPNTIEHVLNLTPGSCLTGCDQILPTFPVVLDAGGVALVREDGERVLIESYEWTIGIAGEEPAPVISTTLSHATTELAEGEYEVRLDVQGGGSVRSLAGKVVIEDILIVSIGDSFAAGEGNPEQVGDPVLWGDSGAEAMNQQAIDHNLAHRSSLGGPAQAALAIEQSDTHSSVTFVFLAASGASIAEGVLGSLNVAEGVDEEGFRRSLRPQMEELKELMGCSGGVESCRRTIDALTISLGGNDIGFSFTLGSLIVLDPLLVVSPLYETLLGNLMDDAESQIEQLPALFSEVAENLAGVAIREVYLTAYPDSTLVSAGGTLQLCDKVGEDLVPGLEVDANELRIVGERLIGPLNGRLDAIAEANDWDFVDGHLADFEGHGYCGSDPYNGGSYTGNPYPDVVATSDDPEIRWFRRAAESAAIQGGGAIFTPERLGTTGTFHPNEFGQQAYKDALLTAMGYARP